MTFNKSALSRTARKKAKSAKRTVKKEIGWNNYVKPISSYNSRVHPSMRIVFEQI